MVEVDICKVDIYKLRAGLRDRIVGFFVSKILGCPFCYSLQRLLGNYSKVLGILHAVKVSCLKWETACRFSTTVV